MPLLGAGMLRNHLQTTYNSTFFIFYHINLRILLKGNSDLRGDGVQVVDPLLVDHHHAKVGQVQNQPLLNLNYVPKLHLELGSYPHFLHIDGL